MPDSNTMKLVRTALRGLVAATLVSSALVSSGCGVQPDDVDAQNEAVTVEADAISPAAAGTPSQPTLSKELLGCQGSVAQYEVFWGPGSGATPTSYDVGFRRGSGAWGSLSHGAARSAIFSTSDGHTSVTFRARACNAAGCSSYRTSGPFIPTECGGGGGGNPL
jgi:hypothetical protein